MIQYSLISISADELSFKVNPNHVPEKRSVYKPIYSRHIHLTEDQKHILVVLQCVIAPEESPFPFNISVRYAGLFEVANINTEEDKRLFALNATETLLPYIRTGITNLMTAAYVPPIFVPIQSSVDLFPEDRGPDQYTIQFDPKVIK